MWLNLGGEDLDFLFAIKYYKSNKKRFFPIIITLILVVFMLCILEVLSSSLSYSTYMSWVKPVENMSIVSAVSPAKPLSSLDISSVEEIDLVDKVMPIVFNSIYIKNNVGGNMDTMLFAMKEEDRDFLMKHLKVEVKSGRLPKEGTNEIAIHWRVVANKKLKIGDHIGKKVDSTERLEGDYEIVGLLEGDPIVSFSSIEYIFKDESENSQNLKQYGMCLIPKNNQRDNLNETLVEMKNEKLRVYSYDTELSSYHSAQDMIDLILKIIGGILTVVLALMIGLISYIFYYQRRNEFGILLALGFRGKRIMSQILIEIAIITFGGFVLGILFMIISSLLLNHFLFMPKGLPLEIWSISYLKTTVFIPVSIFVFSFVPVWRMIRKLDPISIIEGE